MCVFVVLLPLRTTRTYTLFPVTTLFISRSSPDCACDAGGIAASTWLRRQASKSARGWAITIKPILACSGPQYSEHWPRKVPGWPAVIQVVLTIPGITSVLPPSRLIPARNGRDNARSNTDRKSVVEGKSVSVRVDHVGRRFIKKKNK